MYTVDEEVWAGMSKSQRRAAKRRWLESRGWTCLGGVAGSFTHPDHPDALFTLAGAVRTEEVGR